MARNYYMVRAMGSTEKAFQVFLQNEVVAIGWSEVDFTKYSDVSELRDAIEKAYYSNPEDRPTNSSLGRKHAAIKRFNEIKDGDYIIVPYHNQILLAQASGVSSYSYNKEHAEVDLRNQRKVNYLKNDSNELKRVLRSELSDGLQRRLRMLGSTVLDLSEFKKEIDSLFSNKYESKTDMYRQQEDGLIQNFKGILIKNIAEGKTNLAAGGQGFEKLVKELLECEGFLNVEIISKRTFKEKDADADISAKKNDIFLGEQSYLFQVKHHTGVSSAYGIKQLIKAKELKTIPANHHVFITTADEIDDEAQSYADKHDIICMKGDEFAEWLYSSIDKLSMETRQKLNISMVPRFVEE